MLHDVCQEIENLHRFFVRWFNGEAQLEELESEFADHMDDDLFFMSPDGNQMGKEGLLAMFKGSLGKNPNFRIQIEDVQIRRELKEVIVVTYKEIQQGAKASNPPDNVRITTAILSKTQPFRWYHIHETWVHK